MYFVERMLTIIRGIFIKLFLITRGGRKKVGKGLRVGKHCRIRIRKGSHIVIGQDVVIGDYVKLSALKGGIIVVSDKVGIGDYSIIVSHKRIELGRETNVAPCVTFFDHDHVFGREGVERDKYKTDPIIIGEKCWIGVNTVLLRGSTVGNCCTIGASSVVKGQIKDGTLFYNKRESVEKCLK